VEIDVREYGPLNENDDAFSCACSDDMAVSPAVSSPDVLPCSEPCSKQARECNWQGKGLVALSASVAAIAIFTVGCSVRCRHELELERLRLQVQLSSAERAVIEAQHRADEAFRALVALAQSPENEREN